MGEAHSPNMTLGELQLLIPPAAAPQSLCAWGTPPRGLGSYFLVGLGFSLLYAFLWIWTKPCIPPSSFLVGYRLLGAPRPTPPPSNRRRRRKGMRRGGKPPSLLFPPQQGSDWVPVGLPRTNGVSPFFLGGGGGQRSRAVGCTDPLPPSSPPLRDAEPVPQLV